MDEKTRKRVSTCAIIAIVVLMILFFSMLLCLWTQLPGVAYGFGLT